MDKQICTRCKKEGEDYTEITLTSTDGSPTEKYFMCPECMKLLEEMLPPPPEIEYFPEAIASLKNPYHAPYYGNHQSYKKRHEKLPTKEDE